MVVQRKVNQASNNAGGIQVQTRQAIRKGILPIVGGQRRKGTTVITEDVCFQIEDFTKGIEMITELFKSVPRLRLAMFWLVRLRQRASRN